MTARLPQHVAWAIAVCLIALCLIAATGGRAAAQSGTVRGVVRDSAAVPVAGADVSIVAQHQLTRTDAEGRFTFTKLPPGEHEVSVRRLGYVADKVKIIANDAMAYSYEIVLQAQPAMLGGVDVTARSRLAIEDFYRRRARGIGGTFFTRADIASRNARQTSDVIRGVAGARIILTRGGVQGVRFSGHGRRECTPVIWLDGQPADNLEVDQIPVMDIEGMEIYGGAATTPSQFAQKWSKESCGAIIIWTRVPGTP